MKTPFFLILAILFFVSCESSQSSNDPKENMEEQQEQNKEEKKTSRKQVKDDDRVSGFFDLQVDGTSYKSTQLQDNYCDMTFYNNGEKSFVTIRFRDMETHNALIVSFYGDKDFILDPSGTIEDFMFSDADTKANIQLVPADGNSALSSITMVEGSFNISSFAKGQIEATFNGKGGKAQDAVTKKNLVPLEGEIKLNTENVTEMGKEES
mgnify:CR=1 FL=1